MKIDYKTNTYYDMNGKQIHDGDYVRMDGRIQKVYLCEDGELGVDSTNPSWIERGWAAECEFGIYPFCEADEPVIERG